MAAHSRALLHDFGLSFLVFFFGATECLSGGPKTIGKSLWESSNCRRLSNRCRPPSETSGVCGHPISFFLFFLLESAPATEELLGTIKQQMQQRKAIAAPATGLP